MASRLVGVMRSKDLRYLALEAVVVIFGVLAALLVDRWREELARRDAAGAAVQRLYAEVEQNLREVSDMQERIILPPGASRHRRSDLGADHGATAHLGRATCAGIRALSCAH